MVEVSFPFAVPPGNTMTENQWSQMFRYVLGTGVMSVSFQDALNELAVTPSGQPLQVDIATGAAWIQGHYYQSDAVNTITLPPNSNALARADLIVLECKWGLNAGITATYALGTPGAVYPAGSPWSGAMPPDPVQTYGVKWQLPLAVVITTGPTKVIPYVEPTDITDMRTFIGTGGAQADAIIVAMPNSSTKVRENADFQIPQTTGYVDAEIIINEAFAALPSCGGTVMLSEGGCVTSDSIVPPVNSNLAGCGPSTTITYSAGATAAPMIQVSNPNVTIQDMTLNGGAAPFSFPVSPAPTPTTAYDGIKITANNVNIRRINLSLAKNNGIVVTQSSFLYGIDIRDSTISSCYSNGVVYSANNGRVQNNVISECVGNGIDLAAEASQLIASNKITGNLIFSVGMDGVALNGSNAGCNVWYNTVSDNEIVAVGQLGSPAGTNFSGIILLGTGNTYNSIMANHISGSALYGGVVVISGVGNTRIIGNQLYDSSGDTTRNIVDGGSNTVKNYNLTH